MKRTLIVSALALVALLLVMPGVVFGQSRNPVMATREFVLEAIQEFNEQVVDPLADAVAALQGDLDELEQRVETLEAQQDGDTGSGTVRGRVVEFDATPLYFGFDCLILLPQAGRLVTIQATGLSATSGTDGTFAIEGVPAARYFQLDASGEVPDISTDGSTSFQFWVNNVFVPGAGGEVDIGDVPSIVVFEECPPDIDEDGVPNESDNCPAHANPDQQDTDGDGTGDACDDDDDNDGVLDYEEESHGSDPLDPNSTPEHVLWGDSCSDGVDNDLDGLIDGDDPGCQ